ncbi:MAG: aldolase/citrate lyase family protein [Acidimicrobiales bacterium]
MFEHLRVPPAPYAGIRSIIETPILDERKWAKIPTIPADAFLIDLEDAVPAPGKERARELAVEYVREPSYFEGRVTIARPNHLSTPWGREDIEAFAEAEEIIATYETAIEASNPVSPWPAERYCSCTTTRRRFASAVVPRRPTPPLDMATRPSDERTTP